MEFKMEKLGFKHYFNYFKENFIVSFKSLVEYKTNLYNLLFIEVFLAFSMLTFGFVLAENFSEQIGWTFFHFILLYYISMLVNDLAGMFYFNKSLFYRLTEGNFNSYLSKPGNPFLIYIFSYSFNVLISVSIYTVILTVLFIYLKFSILNIFIALLVMFFSIILYVYFYHFLNSVSFFSLKSGEFLTRFLWNGNRLAGTYPYPFFNKLKYKFFMLIFPGFITSALTIPILFGDSIFDLKYQLIFLVILFLISFFGVKFMWKIGLKRYEAFG